MQIAGFAIGIGGLARLYSTRIDSHQLIHPGCA